MSSVCYYPVWNKYDNALHFPIYPVSALNQYQPLCLQQMESWGDTGCNMEKGMYYSLYIKHYCKDITI